MIPLIVIGAILAVSVVLTAAVHIAQGRRPHDRPPLPPVSAELQERVRVLLGRDKRILAIKEVRQSTGMDLVSAKNLVDALRSGPLPAAPAAGGSLADRIRALRDAGGDAVARVCAETGMSRQEAERFVASLD